MKNFSKLSLSKNILLLIIVFLAAGIVRFYNFPNRITFWSEQARSLIVSSDYLKKPSLLGQEYFRTASNGHILFSGAIFNYSLVPLILAMKGDPVLITIFFALLNIFTGFVIYQVAKKIFNEKLAILSTTLFLFNNYMIYHSLFIWNYNFLPLIGILVLYFLYKRSFFWTGLLSGIGVSLQFLFTPIALLVLVINLIKSKRKVLDSAVFIFGAVLGNLPMILFDLRHNFYQMSTLFQYFLDTLKGQSDATFNYYYLLPFWPILAIVGGYIVFWVWNKSKMFAVVVIVIYLFLNLNSKMINWKDPTGMPNGLNVQNVDYASKTIADDAKGDFNISEVLDFDKRAYVLRYFIQYKYDKKPLDEVSYQNLKLLYVLAQSDYNFKGSGTWEVTAGGPYKINKLVGVDGNYAVYKLSK